MNEYNIAEIFYSIQGEGHHVGEPAVFIRFSGCNAHCKFCDTKYSWGEGKAYTLAELSAAVQELTTVGKFIVITGGEPSLQLDQEFVDYFHENGNYYLAVETNGSGELPENLDWVTCSPKGLEIKITDVDELKCVLAKGDRLPVDVLGAQHKYVSPMFGASGLIPENLDWCVSLVKENPEWKLTVQLHKLVGIR